MNSNILNWNLASIFPNQNGKKALHTFILSFLAKQLIDKWYNSYKNVNILKSFTHPENWNELQIQKESFTNEDKFFIEFELIELLDFLNISNRTQARNRIMKEFKELTQISLEFWVKEKLYYQPFVYSLEIEHKRGIPVKIGLILHPYVVYNLVDIALILSNNQLLDLYQIIEKYKLNTQKKIFDSVYFTLLQLLKAYQLQSPADFKLMLSNRHLRKPELRNRQINMFFDLMSRYQEKSQMFIGVYYENQRIIPIHKTCFFQLLNRSTNNQLNQAKFFFESKNQLLKIPE